MFMCYSKKILKYPLLLSFVTVTVTEGLRCNTNHQVFPGLQVICPEKRDRCKAHASENTKQNTIPAARFRTTLAVPVPGTFRFRMQYVWHCMAYDATP